MANFALLQMNIHHCRPEDNFLRARQLFAQAMGRTPRPDVVVLPELWSIGFSTEVFQRIDKLAEPENGPSLTLLRQLAREHQVWVAGGSIATRHRDGITRNTSFLIDRQGNLVGDYSKIHLFSLQDEQCAFQGGTKAQVYDTEFGRTAMMICYDIRFCELPRIYAIKQAQLLITTANFPNPRVNHWRSLLIARAIENQMYVVACNRVGSTPECSYPGHSLIIDPWGNVVAEAGEEEEILCGSIELSNVQTVRSQIQVFQDRQPQLYSSLFTE